MNKSIQRAIAILDCLVKSPRPLGISEIARQLDIPKSSASDCLYTLHSCGCVVMNADKCFSIGSTIARLGTAALRLDRLKPLAGSILNSLHRRIRRPAHIFVENSGMALCILSVGDERGSLYAKVGDTLELHLTAAGKAMLAKLDDEDIAAVMGTGCYTVHTSNSIFNHFTLMRELKIVRENGYALERFENNSYSSAVASGFCDFDNRPCAISIRLDKADLEPRNLKLFVGEVSEAAAQMERLIAECTVNTTETDDIHIDAAGCPD